ncbi:MAG: glycoside hydrolase family 2 TIM barrel-domain containing protein [Lachnospiraceae bacterium]
MNFNNDWNFKLGDDLYFHLKDFDETGFESVTLPHDYSILQPYNEEIGEGCTGYLVGGIGIYRKHFSIPKESLGKKVFLCFDGVYNRSSFYINEHFITFHPYGYSPLLLDISDYIQEENALAVRVDHSRYADSRWYTGSGIYRKVEMFVCDKTYIPVWGTKVTTSLLDDSSASVAVTTTVTTEYVSVPVTLETTLLDPTGKAVYVDTTNVTIQDSIDLTQNFVVENPVLWGVLDGNLYKAVTKLICDGNVLQEKITTFGIRDFVFDVDKGFFLNGKHEYIKGVCLHHDAGLVGAAVPKDVWRRRFQNLIDCGCNAIRSAHNPCSDDFLELCDEMGLLVQQEFYDEWDNPKDKRYNNKEKRVDYITRGHHEFFKDYAKSDLQAVVKRDINHPSVIQWSIGNEIEWTYPKWNTATGYFGGDANGGYFFSEPPYSVEKIRSICSKLPREQYEIGDTAAKLAAWTKELDTTRPITANCILPSASYESGYVDALDMVGFSYRRIVYDRCHEKYPDKPIMGTENLGQWHEWKAVLDRDFVAGIFLWTGIDYMGEVGRPERKDKWPTKANQPGLLDCGGFVKPSGHMFRTFWQDQPHIYIATQTLEASLYDLKDGVLCDKESTAPWFKRTWRWHAVNEHYNYADGDQVVVEVYSNCESLTLYVNDEAVSTLKLADFEDRIYKWCIPFTAGCITVKSDDIESCIHTVSAPHAASITADKLTISTDYDETVHIIAQLLDANGHEAKFEEAEVEFIIDGDARIFGFDNGSHNFVADHKCNKVMTNKGHALAIFGGNTPGTISVCAKVGDVISKAIQIEIV